jgi:23S rRNA U2552 (ribose-2'-O)-methylase RlmE/FtsJ
MSQIVKFFEESKYHSTKYVKYFSIYDQLFKKFRNKKITIIEIGILNGGSLHMWKKYFGKKARIIGIDLNPKTKKLEKDGFEIFNGDQTDKNFWIKLFKKIGMVDIIIDDGGHTNLQQSLTAIYTIPFIKNNGLLVIEDTHSSYQKEFNNPSKYSFINFSKKIIDDVNYTYPNLGSFNFSLNKYIYAVEYFESIVCFKIDRKNCKINSRKNNNSKKLDIIDYRYNRIEKKYDNFMKSKNYLIKIIGKILFKADKYFTYKKDERIIRKYFK